MASFILDELTKADVTASQRRLKLRLLARIGKSVAQGDGKQHRLLKRYLSEARSQRRRAFQAWLAWQKRTAEQAPTRVNMAKSRNKPKFRAKVA